MYFKNTVHVKYEHIVQVRKILKYIALHIYILLRLVASSSLFFYLSTFLRVFSRCIFFPHFNYTHLNVLPVQGKRQAHKYTSQYHILLYPSCFLAAVLDD